MLGVNGLGGQLTLDGDDSGAGGGSTGNTHGSERSEEASKRTGKRVSQVHIDIADSMPIPSASGREYVYTVVDDYSRAVYPRSLRFKSAAIEAFKAFKVAAENESGKGIREIMTDNAHELSMGEICDICERDGINVHTTVPYRPTSSSVAELRIGVLTNPVRAMLPTQAYWAGLSTLQHKFTIGHR